MPKCDLPSINNTAVLPLLLQQTNYSLWVIIWQLIMEWSHLQSMSSLLNVTLSNTQSYSHEHTHTQKEKKKPPKKQQQQKQRFTLIFHGLVALNVLLGKPRHKISFLHELSCWDKQDILFQDATRVKTPRKMKVLNRGTLFITHKIHF